MFKLFKLNLGFWNKNLPVLSALLERFVAGRYCGRELLNRKSSTEMLPFHTVIRGKHL